MTANLDDFVEEDPPQDKFCCPVCGKDKSRPLERRNGITLAECVGCSAAFIVNTGVQS